MNEEQMYLSPDSLHPDLFIRVGSFWTGKKFSTYLLAAESCTNLRNDHHIKPVVNGVVTILKGRCANFLQSVEATDSMQATWQEQTDGVLQLLAGTSNAVEYMQKVSEWCAFLDYCELTPFRLSARIEQDDPPHPIWILGTGRFAVDASSPNRTISPAMLSTPVWRPELLFLTEKWLVDFVQENPKLGHFFPFEPQLFAENIDSRVAILSWKDSNFLRYIHEYADISAGMLVFHEYGEGEQNGEVQRSYLNWHSHQWNEMMPLVRDAVRQSSQVSWLHKGTFYDKNMLTTFEINENNLPSNYMDGFGKRIIQLLREAEEWYKN